MKTKKVQEHLIITGVVFYPFQFLTIPLYGSVFDASIFLILLSAILITLRGFEISQKTLIWFLCFIGLQIILFTTISVAPLHRIISGLIWFGGLVLIFLSRKLFDYKSELVCKLIIVNLLTSAAYCFISAGSHGILSRPQAWFSEPSFAGLSFYSASAGLFGLLMLLKMNFRATLGVFLLGFIFFSAGLLTLSMHVAAFAITIFSVLTLRLSLKQLPITILVASSFVFFSMSLLDLDHFSSRIKVTGEVTNLSTLAWLYGFDQMLSAWNLSPLFGMGLGSTGYFPFESDYADLMATSNVGILNVTDAYSAFFRMGIELGLPFLFILAFYLCTRYLDFKRYVELHKIYNYKHASSVIFLFLFSMTMTIGILVKEPTYSRSFVYIAWFFLTTCLPFSSQIGNRKITREAH